MKNLRNIKKAQAHLEVILSVVLFVGFVFSILIFFNPLGVKRIDSSSLLKAESAIMKNVTLSVDRTDVFIKNVNGNCFIVPSPLSDLSGVSASDSSRNQIGASLTGGSLTINVVPGEKQYILFFSDEFNRVQPNSGCVSLPSTEYQFGPKIIDKYVSYENLLWLNRSYMADYSKLRRDLGITTDFFFTVSLRNNFLFNESLSKHKNLNQRMNAKQIPIEIVYKDLRKENGILTLAVW
jgi:hypothetical protein